MQNPFYSVALSESPTIHATPTATMVSAVPSGIPRVSCRHITTTLPTAVQNRRDFNIALILSVISDSPYKVKKSVPLIILPVSLFLFLSIGLFCQECLLFVGDARHVETASLLATLRNGFFVRQAVRHIFLACRKLLGVGEGKQPWLYTTNTSPEDPLQKSFPTESRGSHRRQPATEVKMLAKLPS